MRVLVLVPEVVVVLAALMTLLAGRTARPALPLVRAAVLCLLAAALLAELALGGRLVSLFDGGVIQDRFALFAKLAILVALLIVVASGGAAVGPRLELPAVLLAGFGGMVVASAGDMFTLWAGLQLAAFACVVTALRRSPVPGRRLLLVAGASSAAFALSLGLLYGIAGFSTLRDVQRVMGFEPLSAALALTLLVGMLAVAAWFLVPWLATAETSVGPGSAGLDPVLILAAGSAVLVLFKLASVLSGVGPDWAPFLALFSALLIAGGGLAAIAARSLTTLVSAAIMTQLGWVAASALASYRLGVGAGLFLFGSFLVASSCLVAICRATPEIRIARLAGLVVTSPARALGLAVLTLSLAGVPPLAGAFGEFTVALELARYGYFWLVGIAVLGSTLTAFAGIRLIRVLFLEPVPLDVLRGGRPVGRRSFSLADAASTLALVLVVVWGLFAYPIHALAVQGGAALWVH